MPARHSLPPIEVVVFVVGAASLGAEIAAARLLAPSFGASTIIWANTIATVLVALSAGYWLGGRLADRDPDDARPVSHRAGGRGAPRRSCPFVADPFLRLSVTRARLHLGRRVHRLAAAVLALVAVPVLLLGMCRALRDPPERRHGRGVRAGSRGRLYAISTVGSLAGVFLAALALIPLIGTRRTFLVFALALAVVAVLGLARRSVAGAGRAGRAARDPGRHREGRRRRPGDLRGRDALPVRPRARGRRRDARGSSSTRARPSTRSTGRGALADRRLLGSASSSCRSPPGHGRRGRIAILGNAAGTTARAYGHYFPQTAIDAVEIDGELTEIGRRCFGLRGPRLQTFTEDARPFLERTGRRYDAIFIDAYRQPYIPFYLATKEFFCARATTS